ncbi:hypothetical protein N431DRAFT_323643 [Stipitochalara longipes BDJ]|nr:hypothetical protein N431DRAFT_323643 [Stipitochalara longipes BDJ]
MGLSVSNGGEAAPPSYSETISSKYISDASTSQYYSSQIQSQLQTLTTQISSLQTQKSLLSHAQDEKILSLLTHEIQLYLSDFAKTGLQKGTLILVPAQGIEDPNALPMQYDFKDPDEYDRVVRVRDKEESGHGSHKWFWRDEDMAIRLAGYLEPKPDPRIMGLPPRKEEIAAQQQQAATSSTSGKWSWSRKKSSAKPAESPPLVESRNDTKIATDIKMPSRDAEDKVLMDVKAEEVVFRTENDFGIFGTERGWGVVLKLKVILGSR